MHHHHVLSDNCHPRYFDEVSMRYFHRPRNKFYCSAVSADRLWSLDPDDVEKPATAYDGNSTPLTGVIPFNYLEILEQDVLTGWFRY